jgi:hypothetical protein
VKSFRLTPGLAPTQRGASTATAVVLRFLAEVRLTGNAEAARKLMASRVPAHQVISERDETVVRTPAQYAAHARELLTQTGEASSFEVTEILTDDDRVYVRWLLSRPASRTHPAGLREVGSAVYRVESGRLAEYWIQLDRYAAAGRKTIRIDRE